MYKRLSSRPFQGGFLYGSVIIYLKMKIFFLTLFFVLSANPTCAKVYITDSSILADVTVKITDSSILADCYLLESDITDSQILADITINITDSSILADKYIKLTDSVIMADPIECLLQQD